MGKQKQQSISRFFAPKPKPSSPPPQPTPQTKIAATVSFSPSKRKLLSSHLTHQPQSPFPIKRSKLSPHTQNPTPSLHQKFLLKLLEPSPPPQDGAPQMPPLPSNSTKFTPLEQQVVELKAKYPDVLLMVEVGYKFRFFGEDAAVASRVLGIYSHLDHNFLTASVPSFRLNVHVRRLVSEGYKVGVVKQTETAAIKAHGDNKSGPFCRGLSALYTKATLEAAEDVGGKEDRCGGESSYLCCVVEKGVNLEVEEERKVKDKDKDKGGVCGEVVDVRFGVVGVEVSTGDVIYGEFDDGFLRSGLEGFLLNLAPVELLLGCPLSKPTEKFLLAYAGPASNIRAERTSNCFSDGGARSEVLSLFEKLDEDNTTDEEKQMAEKGAQRDHRLAVEGIMKMPELAVQALALTMHHLQQFGFQRILCLGASFRQFLSNTEMNLSANTLQQLEVLRNNSDGSESGSLLHIMNHSLTIYGSRLLRHWITHPLCDRNIISARLDAVSEIAEYMGSYKNGPSVNEIDMDDSDLAIVQPDFYYVLSNVLTTLGRSTDIQRGITRIFHRTCTASEFIVVIGSILHAGKQLQRLCISEEHDNERTKPNTVHSTLLRKLIATASSASVIGNAAKLSSALNKEAAEQGDLPNLIVLSEGQFSEVSKARKAVQMVKENLDSLITRYQKKLGMHNLEFISVSGITHLIELPSDYEVPSNWVKVNSTKKTIRYHPPEVLSALDQLSLANEELMIVCRAAWDSFLRGFANCYSEFRAAVQALAALDCLHSLASLSRKKSYVRPLFVEDDEPVQIHVSSGRHPVLETLLQDDFVPNDTDLHADREFCQIVTGPNMGGKSCYIRQVALIALMAQVGSFVPASSARLHVLDGIYTRMGASDSIQQGRSTFLEELSEASYILQKCTARSLVIMDELGRGTSTHDGSAIAYATLHHLLKEKHCMVLFVTHYPEIADIQTAFPGSVGVYHVLYLTPQKNASFSEHSVLDDEDVTYLYKVVPGVSEKSFGFKVAELAQLPSSCIRRAKIMAARLEDLGHGRTGDREDDGRREARGNLVQSSDCFLHGKKSSQELCNAYRELFSLLKLAFLEGKPSDCIRFLEDARVLGKELLTR